MSGYLFTVTLLIVAALGVGAETLAISRAGRQLAAGQRQVARLEAQVRTLREQQAQNETSQQAAGEKLAALQISAATKETRNAQAILWRNRIKALQERLAALPEENIPEFKLLGMKDWIDAVLYTETATDEQMQKVLGGLRNRARARFAALLPEALTRFTENSGGELPGDVLELLPYLPPPADAEMLNHYTLRRSGKIAQRDEELLAFQLPDNGAVISISPSGYGFKAHPDQAEMIVGGASDLSDSLPLDGLGSDHELEMKKWVASLESLGPAMEQAFAPLDDAFGDRLKAAVKQYSAANGGRPPPDVSQLRGYLPDYDQLADRLRQVRAFADYLLDHGKPADDPAQMRRYVERPVDPARTLKALKLTVDGEHVSLELSL